MGRNHNAVFRLLVFFAAVACIVGGVIFDAYSIRYFGEAKALKEQYEQPNIPIPEPVAKDIAKLEAQAQSHYTIAAVLIALGILGLIPAFYFRREPFMELGAEGGKIEVKEPRMFTDKRCVDCEKSTKTLNVVAYDQQLLHVCPKCLLTWFNVQLLPTFRAILYKNRFKLAAVAVVLVAVATATYWLANGIINGFIG